jgi:hypothetical protein
MAAWFNLVLCLIFLNSDTPLLTVTIVILTRFSAAEKATLEALRSQLVRKNSKHFKSNSCCLGLQIVMCYWPIA